ncbi:MULTISPECIES: ROK family transcriptional regulator [Actinomadura]|uniref:ROK family transcriptional regulator n=1 Tax=Actinomadura geliboluensis TaxID=882440 RepID=A0A5S4GGB9_9ACTN|nr:ROK family transcriptional regulator [Actinomadura geliboluensis]TMR32027.1 ROK family transcriptional regulator [Actinomadura geliboluensis]
MKAGPSQEDVRRHNLGTLLRFVHLRGPASRATLAESLGLNRSTIMALTSDLTAAGLVREELPRGPGRRAGRPSLVVRPESTRVYVLAFEVGVDRLVVARVGLGGVVLDRREGVRARDSDPADLLGVLVAGARALVRKAERDAVCVGAALGFPGTVRRADDTIMFGPNLDVGDLRLGDALSRRLGLGIPVSVCNDANLGALAEHERGAGVNCDNLIYLHGDVGVGGGIIAHGRLLGGDEGFGGEIGHMIINPGGRRCACGSKGCLEAEVGERALLDHAGQAEHPGQAGRDAVRAVLASADAGDIAAREALQRVGTWLGLGVASLVNVFNPGMIVFGGTLRDIYLGAAAQIRSVLATGALAAPREKVKLRTAALGDDTTLVGAAEFAFAEVLSDPVQVLTRLRAPEDSPV